MSARTVISFVMDLIGSTATGLGMNEILFRRYNKAIVEQIWPYVRQFDLEASTLKFTGDGWLLFSPDLDRARAIVALAKTLSATFQKEIARNLGLEEDKVPALRLAICTGEDEEVEFGDKQKDWVGDSARRATRASGCCAPNQLIVNSTIKDKIFRAFATQTVVVNDLPEDRHPKRWEEDFQIYSVGEIRDDFVDDLRFEDDPAASAPYVTYLHIIGRTADAQRIFTTVGDAIAAKNEAISAQEARSPAEISRLADVGAQMRKLLYSAPNREMRDDIVRRMTRLSVQPTLPVYNSLISKSPSYRDAIDWFNRMRREDLAPDVITYNTLINLSPDLETARGWFDAMREAGVHPDEVTYNTLIDLSPDLETARGWFDAMREAGVHPDEVTASSLAKKVEHPGDAERLTGELLDAGAFIGEGYYSALYGRLAQHFSAEELLGWHARQKYRRTAALAAAIRAFASQGQVEEACRVALAFPYLEAAWKVFRDHEEAAVVYFSGLLSEDFEPHNAVYALGYCFLENGRHDEALEMFNEALSLSRQEKRTEDIQKRIAEIRRVLSNR